MNHEIREVHELEDLRALAELFAVVWGVARAEVEPATFHFPISAKLFGGVQCPPDALVRATRHDRERRSDSLQKRAEPTLNMFG